ncbi:MAG: hypothetical protein ACK2UB_13360 [Anaerolineales bacterium]
MAAREERDIIGAEVSTLMRLSRIGRLSAAGLLTLILLVLNLRLYGPESKAYGPDRLGPDVEAQLRFIGGSLRAGSGDDMQNVFPEGYFFSHVLYGLTWVEVGIRQPTGAPLYQEAVREAEWALERLDSPPGRAPFEVSLLPPHGVFYVGWTSWLRGGVLMIQPQADRPAVQVERFRADCRALADAFTASDTPFLSAYPGQAWPVDSVVAAAALRLYDTLYRPEFTRILDRWVGMARARLDPATGLLPHRVDAATGGVLEGARGSSQSLIARFLIEVDPDWGRSQYSVFRDLFLAPFLGVPGVREYPPGVHGFGDVDSGPVVFGFSASATVVEIGAAQVQGDREVADAILSAGEAVGLPLEWNSRKAYAFGMLPVGDAFLAWAKSASLWTDSWREGGFPSVSGSWWRVPFHVVTALLLSILWIPLLRKSFFPIKGLPSFRENDVRFAHSAKRTANKYSPPDADGEQDSGSEFS